MLTVDTAVLANRENNVRSGFSTPLRPSLRLAWDGVTHPRWSIGTFAKTLWRHGLPHFENSYAERGAPIVAQNVTRDFGMRDHLNWEHLAQIRRQWHGRLVVKGIMRGEDARIARDHGVDGIVVSNHGGQQLDGTVSPLRVLPEVVAAAGDMPVMMDSGLSARLGCAEGFGTQRNIRLRWAAVPLRGGDRWRGRCAARHRYPLDRDQPQHGAARHQHAGRDAPRAAFPAEGWTVHLMYVHRCLERRRLDRRSRRGRKAKSILGGDGVERGPRGIDILGWRSAP